MVLVSRDQNSSDDTKDSRSNRKHIDLFESVEISAKAAKTAEESNGCDVE